MKYLYGASVQGIQEFITQTGRLKEIVGASEIVEHICTEAFFNMAGIDEDHDDLIRAAAGNIRFLFNDEEACAKIVRDFPRKVMEMAPGIRISQAVIPVDETGLSQALEKLEVRLQIQRNRVPRPMEIGFMGLERCRRSGNVAVDFLKKEPVCASILEKEKASTKRRLLKSLTGVPRPDPNQFHREIDKMVLRDGNRWVAVVHADGNGMGKIIQHLGGLMNDEKNQDRVKTVFRTFSRTIDQCTKRAVQKAFHKVIPEFHEANANQLDESFPIRPLVIGGDDLTIVMRADLALEFTVTYLQAFEEETTAAYEKMFREMNIKGIQPGLTVCAGIAYVGDSYPFHYAHDLAEKLCLEAKNFSKELMDPKDPNAIAASSLSFYKVQDSFIESNIKIIRTRTQQTATGFKFNYGPYLLHKVNGNANVEDLQVQLQAIRELKQNDENASLSKLRKWVTEAYRNKDSATFLMDRIEQIEADRGGNGLYKRLNLKEHRDGRSAVMELLQLHGFND